MTGNITIILPHITEEAQELFKCISLSDQVNKEQPGRAKPEEQTLLDKLSHLKVRNILVL